MTEPSEVQVLRIRPVLKPGSLRAFVDIKVGGIIMNKLRIFQENGKEPSVGMPTESFKPTHGPTRYTRLIEIEDKKLMDQISQAVLKAWENGKGGSDESRK